MPDPVWSRCFTIAIAHREQDRFGEARDGEFSGFNIHPQAKLAQC